MYLRVNLNVKNKIYFHYICEKEIVIYYYIIFYQTFVRVMKSRGFNKPRKQMHHIFHGDVISFSMFIKIEKKNFLLTSRNIIPFVKI